MNEKERKPLALITGASAGIGAATAQVLAQAGFELVLLARRGDRLKKIGSDLSEFTKIHTFQVDLQNREQLAQFIDTHQDLLSRIEVLVNNAGLARGVDKVQNSEVTHWDEMLETNVRSLLVLTRAVLPGMVKRNLGHIVNIGSVAGRWTYPGGAVYCATKAAVKSISEGLRMDLLGTSIRVTNIEPGLVESEFSNVRLGNDEAASKVYERMQPLKPEDIAETILWCLNRPAHVNIQELVVFPTEQAAVGQVHRR